MRAILSILLADSITLNNKVINSSGRLCAVIAVNE